MNSAPVFFYSIHANQPLPREPLLTYWEEAIYLHEKKASLT